MLAEAGAEKGEGLVPKLNLELNLLQGQFPLAHGRFAPRGRLLQLQLLQLQLTYLSLRVRQPQLLRKSRRNHNHSPNSPLSMVR